MGLFQGRRPKAEGCTAHLLRALQAVLVPILPSGHQPGRNRALHAAFESMRSLNVLEASFILPPLVCGSLWPTGSFWKLPLVAVREVMW